jgi:O-antigen ligase
MTEKRIFGLSLTIFFLLRIFSFVFTPDTPLWGASIINIFVSIAIAIAVTYFLINDDNRGWYVVAGEIILGGSGSYLGVGNISLRTLLLIFSLTIFLIKKIQQKKIKDITNDKLFFVILSLGIWVIISAIIGIKNGHAINSVIADTIPYLFLGYYFPLKEVVTRDQKFLTITKNILVAALIGNFIVIIFTFFGFSTGIFSLQDHYYHWYRDVAAGKITALPFYFYRLVLNEHLLIVPILLWLLLELIQRKNSRLNWALGIMTILVLAISLTRIYYLALFAGILILFKKTHWLNWLKHSIAFVLILITGFTAIHFIASRGHSLGWEIFGLRLQSITSPSIEDSSLSRLLLLPKIKEKIADSPIFGEGLGSTVTVYSPVFKQAVTTTNFDWGYLEIWTELGLVGLLLWGALLVIIIKNTKFQTLPLAMVGSLMVINFTAPALFHVFGIILLVIVAAKYQQTYGVN